MRSSMFRLLLKKDDKGNDILKVIPGYGHSFDAIELPIGLFSAIELKAHFKIVTSPSGVIELQYIAV